MKNILIKGAGVGGLTTAFMLQQKGFSVTISAPPSSPIGTASWYAGGMLAPYCEREIAEQIVEDLGIQAIEWWYKTLPYLLIRKGTLVVAPARDKVELERFSERTHHHRIINGEEIACLEPDLAERFNHALFYENEAHLDPRKALIALKENLIKNGACFVDIKTSETNFDIIIDATGIARLGKDKIYAVFVVKCFSYAVGILKFLAQFAFFIHAFLSTLFLGKIIFLWLVQQ